jgi:hypothetical protein
VFNLFLKKYLQQLIFYLNSALAIAPKFKRGRFMQWLIALACRIRSYLSTVHALNQRCQVKPNTGLNILHLVNGTRNRNNQSEEELQEIKSLLTTYLASKVTMETDKAFDENG